MGSRCVFFAGGGTGGHIYPAMAVAEQLRRLDSSVHVHFFCGNRRIDADILKPAGYEYTVLPARGLSVRPDTLLAFVRGYMESRRIAQKVIADFDSAVVVGVGGFVAAPACHAARRARAPVKLINVDIVPGRANKLIARWADEAFIQFEQAGRYFAAKGAAVRCVGCPLRAGFADPQAGRARQSLELDPGKKMLLVTGASSGAASINEAVCTLLERLGPFADTWQVVHLAGRTNEQTVAKRYERAPIAYKVLGYYEAMWDLLAAAEMVIGRSGAVSVAEYAVAGVPAICMPYPYHRDRQQYLNAAGLVEAGAAVIVDDVPDAKDRAEWLWEELEPLLKDDRKRAEMRQACKAIAKPDAARKIAEAILPGRGYTP